MDLVGVVKCVSYAAMQLWSYAAMQLCSFVSSLQIECKKLAASDSLEAVPDTHAPVLGMFVLAGLQPRIVLWNVHSHPVSAVSSVPRRLEALSNSKTMLDA